MKRLYLTYLGIVLLIINFYSNFSSLLNFGSFFSRILLFCGLFLLIVSSYLKKDNKFFFKTFFYFLSFISYYYSKQTDFLQLCIVLVSLQDENLDNILEIVFKINLFLILTHILLYFLLLLMNSSLIHYNFRIKYNTIELRHTFLFSHSNVFSALVCWCYLEFLYLYKSKKILLNIVIFLITFILIFFFSKTRTVIFVIFMTLLLIYLLKRIDFLKKNSLFKYSPILISILFIAFIFLYPHSSLIQYLDSILEARIKLGYVAYKIFGISFLGQYIDYGAENVIYWNYGLGSSGFTLDSTFYKILFSNGILNYLLFVIFMFFRIKKIDLNSNKIVFLISYSLFSSVESFGFYPFLAFPLLFLCFNNFDGNKVVL